MHYVTTKQETFYVCLFLNENYYKNFIVEEKLYCLIEAY